MAAIIQLVARCALLGDQMTITNAVPKSFLLLTQSLCVSAVLICSYPNYLWSSGELICTGAGFIHKYTNPSGLEVAECQLSNGKCDSANASASVINKTQTVLSITHIKTTDAGEWTCTSKRNVDSRCNLTVVKTPTCSITSKQDTNSLVQYQELSLTVDVRDYYCSTAHNISLQTGNVTTLLMKADSVPSVTDNTSSVTLNVTDSHLGKVGLVFRCDSSQWSVECAGVTKFVPRTPACNITSDKDTEILTLHEAVTLTVDITAYYDIRGSHCSADSNFTLQTGDVSQLLHVGDHGLSPITFNMTETHLGGVRLVFNCQVQHWNLSCGGVTRLNNKIKGIGQIATSSTIVIIAGVVGAALCLIVLAIIIFLVVKRKSPTAEGMMSTQPGIMQVAKVVITCILKLEENIRLWIEVLSNLQTYTNLWCDLVDKYQSAYREHHNTETAPIHVSDILRQIVDAVALILLDMPSAFDTVDHSVLLQILKTRYGIAGTALKDQGVTQGSVLGPLLFVLCIGPFADITSTHSLQHHSYADNQLIKAMMQISH
ncbi:uncharacterized protein [Haliotis asinina]|uniref:uncharacterized protein n=1 Tax=Haliotis asinina TaxID=109174 RepID=UPI00353279FC